MNARTRMHVGWIQIGEYKNCYFFLIIQRFDYILHTQIDVVKCFKNICGKFRTRL